MSLQDIVFSGLSALFQNSTVDWAMSLSEANEDQSSYKMKAACVQYGKVLALISKPDTMSAYDKTVSQYFTIICGHANGFAWSK